MAVVVLAFVKNWLGLAGVTPEQRLIVTGMVLVVTLILFSGGDVVKRLNEKFLRARTSGPG